MKLRHSLLVALVLLAGALLLQGSQVQPRKLRIAAAADLKFAMDELSREFAKQTGANISVTYGSSGNFFAQLENGAPFDVFFSADIEYPRKLEAQGLAERGTLFEYAVGRIVIWLPKETKLDLAKLGWQALRDPSISKIAIANPEHAPYGRAAVEALQQAGVYEAVKDKLVYGENISQAAQFVQSGNAQAGIIAMSLAVSPEMRDGKRWEIPAEMHRPLEQGAVLLNSAENKELARDFLQYVKGAAGRAALSKYGFAVPEQKGAEK